MTFRLGGAIELPASAPTSTFAYLGIRGYGKTYAAGVQVEEFLAAGVQVVIVDPVGVWFGLRLAAGGKNPSRFDVPVFGGSHGDLPLEPTAGELIAKIAVESRRSLVLDVSDWTLGEQRRFVTAFATQLFQLKKANRSPIHLVFEEAHEFFPQFVEGAAAPLVGATNRLWKIGRNYGIGGTLISQRAAEVNKSALNLTETLITTRLKAPEDVKRIDGWANANGVDDKAIALLPSLPKRQVIVWTDEGAQVTQFNPKETFDSSRTPEEGDAAPAPGPLPALDLEAIRAAMAATIEEAKANDPKALRAEVAKLRAELATAPGRHEMVGKISADAVALATERDQWRDHCREAERRLKEVHQAFDGATPAELRRLRVMESSFNQVIDATAAYQSWNREQLAVGPGTGFKMPVPETLEQGVQRVSGESRIRAASMADSGALTKCPREILAAPAARHPTPLTKVQLATLAGYAPSGGGFNNAMGELKGKGLIERDGDSFAITAAGLKLAPRGQTPRTPAELVDFWCSKLTGRAKDMLRLLSRSRRPLTKEEIAREVGMEVSAGGFNNYLGTLRSNGLVQKTRGGFEAASSLVVR